MNMIALADFSGMSEEAVKEKCADDFGIPLESLTDTKIVVAYMSVGSWGCDSSAFIVFRKGGELYEVNGSHCSCYGFSESDYSGGSTTQWQPELVPDVAVVIQRSDYCLAGGGYDDDKAANAEAIRNHLKSL